MNRRLAGPLVDDLIVLKFGSDHTVHLGNRESFIKEVF